MVSNPNSQAPKLNVRSCSYSDIDKIVHMEEEKILIQPKVNEKTRSGM